MSTDRVVHSADIFDKQLAALRQQGIWDPTDRSTGAVAAQFCERLFAHLMLADGTISYPEIAFMQTYARNPLPVSEELAFINTIRNSYSEFLTQVPRFLQAASEYDRACDTRYAADLIATIRELGMLVTHAGGVPEPRSCAMFDRYLNLLQRTTPKRNTTTPSAAAAPLETDAAMQAPAVTGVSVPQSTTLATDQVDELLRDLNSLVGLHAVKNQVRRLVNLLRLRRLRSLYDLPSPTTTLHLVFVGNPGTGKTMVARKIAQIYQALGFLPTGHLVETDRGGLVAGYVGQTAMKTLAVLESARGGILFIDEAYSLAPSSPVDFGTEAISTMLKYMEDHRADVAIILAGYSAPMEQLLASNPGLSSRFETTLTFDD